MGKFVYGIDLGTTYSCICYVDENGRPTIINNMEGNNTTPSVVNFASPTQVVVGQVAKETAVIDPNNTVALVKTLMGKTNFAINYNGEDVTPEQVSNYILRKMTEDASKLIDSEVKDVVVTCPAYFGDNERKATRAAAEIAGLNVMALLNEPTAAALYYGCTSGDADKTVMVYDLGGGTFDVTIMHIKGNEISVICSDGLAEVGGKDWDEALMSYLASEFCNETGFGGDFDEYAQQDLRIKAENAKIQLTQREQVPVMLDAAGLRGRITVTRETFESLTEGLLAQTIEKTDAAIQVAKDKGFTVDEILLVGGSTRMPQVARKVTETYGLEPKILDPDEAVAKGAAIYAVACYQGKHDFVVEGKADASTAEVDPDEAKHYTEKLDVDIGLLPGAGAGKTIVIKAATTKSYALKVLVKGQEQCCNMIIKNTEMPEETVAVTKRFGTADANQTTAELAVYENDFMDDYFQVDEDLQLGVCSLELPGNLPAGSPIEVTFELDREGLLKVTGKDLVGGKDIHAEMRASSGATMTEEEVQAAREKSKNIVVE